jgi:hypothetical protein
VAAAGKTSVAQRMEFGLAQATGHLAKALRETVDDPAQEAMMWKIVGSYFDDIYSKGSSAFEQLWRLGLIFERMNQHGWKLSLDKSSWLMQQLVAVGFLISCDGIRPDPARVEVFACYPRPLNAQQLRSFIGLVNYMMHLIPHCAQYLLPLYQLLRPCMKAYTQMRARDETLKPKVSSNTGVVMDAKTSLTAAKPVVSTTRTDTKPLNEPSGQSGVDDSTFFAPKSKKSYNAQAAFFTKWTLRWTQNAVNAFDALKTLIKSGRYIGAYRSDWHTILETDASLWCSGAICAQADPDSGRMTPLAFYSRAFRDSELTLSVVEKEAIAAVE